MWLCLKLKLFELRDSNWVKGFTPTHLCVHPARNWVIRSTMVQVGSHVGLRGDVYSAENRGDCWHRQRGSVKQRRCSMFLQQNFQHTPLQYESHSWLGWLSLCVCCEVNNSMFSLFWASTANPDKLIIMERILWLLLLFAISASSAPQSLKGHQIGRKRELKLLQTFWFDCENFF